MKPIAGMSRALSNAATCPSACTPASVRPAKRTRVLCPVRLAAARSSSDCTVRCAGWICEPAKSVPSYAITRHTPCSAGLTSRGGGSVFGSLGASSSLTTVTRWSAQNTAPSPNVWAASPVPLVFDSMYS